ncbi:MAG: SGNH/GDSL hydrolase family protein, partial [Myxococcota bacterium]
MHPIHDLSARDEELRIAGLGDSLTYGWMVQRGFFDRFCDSLARQHPRAKVTRFNEGVPGDTARGGLARLPGLLAREPHVVMVQFGLNDLFCGVEPRDFARSLERIVEGVHAGGAVAWLVVSSPLADPDLAAAALPFYDTIRTINVDQELPLANLDAYWRERADPCTAAGAHFLEDGVHPDEEGHALMAE